MIKYLFFLCFAQVALAQTVSTFLNDSSVDVDDAMAFDATGNLFGSNFDGTTVYKITPAGVATPFVTGLQNPNGLAFDDDGNLYVAEYSASRINKYAPDGSLLDMFDTGGLTSGLIKDANSSGFLFTNVSNNSVNILGLDGAITPLFTGAPLLAPVGLAFDETGILYVGNFTGREIYKISSGIATFVATVPNGGAGPSSDALGFITYAGGRLFGTNFGGHEIYSINPNGINDIVLYAGGNQGDDDGPIATATFDTPNGIIYNALENALYISEFSGEGNIRKIEDAVLAIPSFHMDAVVLYPNPTSRSITMQFTTNEHILDIQVFSVQGQLIETQVLQNAENKIEIDVAHLSNGAYFIRGTTENTVLTKHFIKK